MLERKGDVAGREVGKMRQGREGLLSSRGPFAGVWGPFCRKGGLFSLDFSVGLPEALPWGQQPPMRVGCSSARSFFVFFFPMGAGEKDTRVEGCKGGDGQGEGKIRFLEVGAAAGGLGAPGSGHHGIRSQAPETTRKIQEARKEKSPPATTLGTVPLPPGPTTPRTASPRPPRAAPCVGTTDPRF